MSILESRKRLIAVHTYIHTVRFCSRRGKRRGREGEGKNIFTYLYVPIDLSVRLSIRLHNYLLRYLSLCVAQHSTTLRTKSAAPPKKSIEINDISIIIMFITSQVKFKKVNVLLLILPCHCHDPLC